MTISRRRFWIKPEETIDLSDSGFLPDPDVEWGKIWSPALRGFETIAATRCLCLLGEPGMGKSTALRDAFEQQDGPKAFVDLRPCASGQDVREAIFRRADYLAWLTSGSALALFIDSLDECLLRVDNVAAILADGFAQAPTDRLFLRLTCRTAEWQHSLEQKLRKKYGDSDIGIFELAPLRRIDVVSEAKAEGIVEADEFLREVITREAVPLAIKPVTLRFLIDQPIQA